MLPRPQRSPSKLEEWLLKDSVREPGGPFEVHREHEQHPWWQVMCLTGVDYFSTLGYQPGIAALAAGALSPIATLVLVLLTLFGALPIYCYVARQSPHGEGSIAMLERLMHRWRGKFFVLCLLGFVGTDFIITITLSAADATAHVVENPLTPFLVRKHDVAITLVLIAILGLIFLKGFKEAISVAVVLVAVYLALNAVVIGVGLYHVAAHPVVISDWRTALLRSHGSPVMIVAVALLLFPKLALGLSGFETGVAVMPLVKGLAGDDPLHPAGRIHNTRRLLQTAAIIMSCFLVTSSIVTVMLIPAREFQAASALHDAGRANGRALAYLAHEYLGTAFGTVYDLSTILILWFAGASAMAGLLNIVPRYLPRYGMAPAWTRAVRPLVLIFTAIAFAVTIVFKADVDAQGGAYATGVLVLMSSASIAVTLSCRRHRCWPAAWVFGLISLVFAYTTIVNVWERPDGIKIASFFIASIVIISLISRTLRTTELRVRNYEIDEAAGRFVDQAASSGAIRIIANQPDKQDEEEYRLKERDQRRDAHISRSDPVLFLEVSVGDASEFADTLEVHGVEVGPYRVLRARSSSVPNAIAAFLLWVRDRTGKIPHVYFHWSEGSPVVFLIRYVFLGEGDTAPVTHEVLRLAEPDPERRPAVHVGG